MTSNLSLSVPQPEADLEEFSFTAMLDEMRAEGRIGVRVQVFYMVHTSLEVQCSYNQAIAEITNR